MADPKPAAAAKPNGTPPTEAGKPAAQIFDPGPATSPPKKLRTPGDPELVAMNRLARLLNDMTPGARKRAVQWLISRETEAETKAATPTA